MPIDKNTRGASDDWEALQMILSDNPDLKIRVLNRIRALRNISSNRTTGITITEEQAKEFRLQESKKKPRR